MTRAPKPKACLVADLFCGAGGTSTGAKKALARGGYRMVLTAVNHWDVAIETHSKNHPEARHYCQDLESAKPEELVPELRLDLLLASPTCTYHSRARGARPINDQQRMDPWHVVRWCTALRVKRLIVENVPEYVEWGPVDARTHRPIKSRKGEYFRAWINALRGCGFELEWRIVNCADYGDPTTRVRFFLLARSDGKRIRWPTPTHAPASKAAMLGLRPWRTARNDVIDWGVPGRSIFTRKKALADNTMRRIEAGFRRFGGPLGQAFLVILRQHMDAKSIDGPVPTVAANGNHIGLAQPELQRVAYIMNRASDAGTGRSRAHSIDDPTPTATCRGAGYLVEGQVKPFVLSSASGGAPRCVDQPIPGPTTRGPHQLVQPFLFPVNQGEGRLRGHRSVDEPVPTVMPRDTFGVVEPFMMPVTHGGDSKRVRSIDDPVATITTANRGEIALVQGKAERVAMIAPYYGSGSGLTCKTADEPLDTVTAKARFGLVDGEAKKVDFMLPFFGERPGQDPRTHDLEEPLPSVTSHGAGGLVEGLVEGVISAVDERTGEAVDPRRLVLIDGQPYQLDIRFRMLTNRELARAMGFEDEESSYEFAGTAGQITRQIGNAVPVNTASALVGAIMDIPAEIEWLEAAE